MTVIGGWFKAHPVLCPGILLLLIRAVGHGIFLLIEWQQPETAIAVILDIPTQIVYFAFASIGWPHNISGFDDGRFFVTGCAIWFVLGCAIGAVTRQFQRSAI